MERLIDIEKINIPSRPLFFRCFLAEQVGLSRSSSDFYSTGPRFEFRTTLTLLRVFAISLSPTAKFRGILSMFQYFKDEQSSVMTGF